MQKLNLPIVIEKDSDGYYAFCPQLQGCCTQGDTYEEALSNLRDAIRLHLEDRSERGEPLPTAEFISIATLEIPYEPALA